MSGNVFPTPTLQWGALLQDPTTAMQVATKEYVDAKVGGIPEAPTDGQTYGRDGQTAAWNPITLAPVASSTAPLMDGTASAGIATGWSRGDHIHPTDTSRYAASNPSGYVNSAGAASAAPVQSVATRTGAITLTHTDITDWASTLSPYALLASPTFTGTPSLPTGATGVTQTVGNSTTALATTAFVQAAVPAASSATPQMDGTASAGSATSWSRADHIHPTDTSRAPLGSPALTGTPTAPTATPGTNNTQIATTAFVEAAIPTIQPASTAPLMDGIAAVGTSLLYARQDHVHPSDTSRAPLASPALTGAPTSTTPATADNSTAIATTAFVKAQGYGAPPSPATVAPLMNGTAAVGTSLLYARQDHVHPTDTTLAPLGSPALTGTPTAPTAPPGTNTTQLATTSYTTAAIAAQATVTAGTYLPTAGGTMSGALNLTATGGSTSRSEQARAADVANVLDFGADPTGVADSSAAFNAAAATLNAFGYNKSVYVPSGQYRINNQISLINGQTLFGDGRGCTRLFCDSNFNMSASSVIMMKTSTQLLDVGPEIHGINISLVQNMSATLRSQMTQYPPVIAVQANCGRWKLLHCRIEGAWNGYTDGGNNVPFSIWDLELGAINVGLQIGVGTTGPQDFCHIHGLHFWNFGFPVTPFIDGNTYAMHVGRCDGLDCTDFSNFEGQILVDGGTGSNTTIIHFTNLKLDGDAASMSILAGNHFHISNLYSTAGTNRTLPTLTVNSNATVHIANWYSHNSSTIGNISVPAGWLSIVNAQIRSAALNCNIASVSGNGILKMLDTTVFASQAGAYTAPLVQQSGANSNLVIDGFKVENLGAASSGTAISIGSDNVGNRLGTVNLPSGWTTSVPATVTNTRPYYPAGALFAGSSTFNAQLNCPGGVQVGSGAGGATTLYLNSAAGNQRSINVLTATTGRWMFNFDGSAESGGNTGTDFYLQRFSDAGSILDNPIAVARSTGLVTLGSAGGVTSVGQIQTTKTGGGNASGFLAQAANPSYGWWDTSQTTDTHAWDAISIGGTLSFRAVNDASSAATNWLTVSRSTSNPQTITLTAPNVTVVGPLYVDGGITLQGGTSNNTYYSAVGLGPPTFTTRSLGTKLTLYPMLSTTAADYGIGIAGGVLWFSVPNTGGGNSFGFYGGTTLVASISDVGNFSVGANQVVGPRIAGWGTPTGGTRTASFPGGTATAAQTAATLAQLILDLKTHGLLGT